VSTKSEGVLGIMGQVIKDLIIEEKFNERTLFGFITFDTSIQVYNFNSKLQQAQMFVLTDASDLPLPGEFLFNL
jgi:protein transport protein SEC24